MDFRCSSSTGGYLRDIDGARRVGLQAFGAPLKGLCVKTLHSAIEIDTAPRRVWDILTDFDSYPTWNPFVTRITGAARVGARLDVRLQPPVAWVSRCTQPSWRLCQAVHCAGWGTCSYQVSLTASTTSSSSRSHRAARVSSSRSASPDYLCLYSPQALMRTLWLGFTRPDSNGRHASLNLQYTDDRSS
jgi:hypothetical protein